MNDNMANGTQEQKVKSVPKLKPRYTLPTDRLRADKQITILRAYTTLSDRGAKGLSAEDIARPTEIHFSNVRKCLPFFSEAGLLYKEDGKYKPAQELIAYREQAEWEESFTAAVALWPLLSDKWFVKAIQTKELCQGRLNRDECINAVIKEAGCERSDRKGGELIIDLLEGLGVIRFGDDGMAVFSKSSDNTEPSLPPSPANQPAKPAGAEQRVVQAEIPQLTSAGSSIMLRIDIKLDSSMDEDKLEKLLAVLKRELPLNI